MSLIRKSTSRRSSSRNSSIRKFSFTTWVRQHRIVSFFALTYTLSWCLLPFGTFLVVVVAVRMIDPFDGPLAEEPSFRGFAQPTLQSGMPLLKATAILGVLVTIWHAPLYFMSQFDLHPIESLATFGGTFVYAWLFNHSGGSVLITLVAHNIEGAVKIGPLWGGTDADRAALIYSIAWFTAGALVVALDWRYWTRRHSGRSIRV